MGGEVAPLGARTFCAMADVVARIDEVSKDARKPRSLDTDQEVRGGSGEGGAEQRMNGGALLDGARRTRC